jgi:rhamnosyltransferase
MTVNANVCAIFITYYPSEKIESNIRKILDKVAQVIIVDNTPEKCMLEFSSNITNNSKIDVFRNGRNVGIAQALNQGVCLARNRGFEWVLTFDQDTEVTEDFIEVIKGVCFDYQFPRRTAVIGSNYVNRDNQNIAEENCSIHSFSLVKYVITSGSLLSVKVFTEIGGFDEKLFIDAVDIDYCFRARRNGYVVLITTKPIMDHSIGRMERKQLLFFNFFVTNHSPFRRYYIFRNTIYIIRKNLFFDPFWSLQMVMNYLPKLFIKACFVEKFKKENFFWIIRGISDGIMSRFNRKVYIKDSKESLEVED